MDPIFRRLASLWDLKWQFLKDVYFLMLNDVRFSSGRNPDGIRYARMSRHLRDNYRVDLAPHKLKYMVYSIKTRNSRKS